MSTPLRVVREPRLFHSSAIILTPAAAQRAARLRMVVVTAGLIACTVGAVANDHALSLTLTSHAPGIADFVRIYLTSGASIFLVTALVFGWFALRSSSRLRELAPAVGAIVCAAIASSLVSSLFLRSPPSLEANESAGTITLNVRAVSDPSAQSFPSVEAACAVALAIAGLHLYESGRVLVLGLAIVYCLVPAVTGVRFFGDVLAGATVGCAACIFWYHSSFARSRLQPWINRRPAARAQSYSRAA